MTTPPNPWPLVLERRTRPPAGDKEKVAEHLRTLLTTENLAQLEKLLAADPRLIAHVRALAKSGDQR